MKTSRRFLVIGKKKTAKNNCSSVELGRLSIIYHTIEKIACLLFTRTRKRVIILSRGHDLPLWHLPPLCFFANFTQSFLHVGRANTRRLFRQENNGIRVEKGGQSIIVLSILVDRAIVWSPVILLSPFFLSLLYLLFFFFSSFFLLVLSSFPFPIFIHSKK